MFLGLTIPKPRTMVVANLYDFVLLQKFAIIYHENTSKYF